MLKINTYCFMIWISALCLEIELYFRWTGTSVPLYTMEYIMAALSVGLTMIFGFYLFPFKYVLISARENAGGRAR